MIYFYINLGFETKTEVYIAMEYLPRGELFDYIVEHGGLNEKEAKKMFTQIASAIAHCHHVSNIN